MVMNFRKRYATEKRPLEWCIEEFPKSKKHLKKLLNRIGRIKTLKGKETILEIGAAQGLLLNSLNELGYNCYGIEPSEDAIRVCKEFSKKFNTKLNIEKGFGEDIPFKGDIFDIVIADSVIEHVKDVEKVFNEVARVLKRGGAFYFSTASALCPYQNEIRYFPFFGWFPSDLKIKIMKWTIREKPEWVGNTDAPAINWFTPWKTNKLLKKAGFITVYDTWDSLNENEFGRIGKFLLRIIRTSKFFRIGAGILTSSCFYVSLK